MVILQLFDKLLSHCEVPRQQMERNKCSVYIKSRRNRCSAISSCFVNLTCRASIFSNSRPKVTCSYNVHDAVLQDYETSQHLEAFQQGILNLTREILHNRFAADTLLEGHNVIEHIYYIN